MAHGDDSNLIKFARMSARPNFFQYFYRNLIRAVRVLKFYQLENCALNFFLESQRYGSCTFYTGCHVYACMRSQPWNKGGGIRVLSSEKKIRDARKNLGQENNCLVHF